MPNYLTPRAKLFRSAFKRFFSPAAKKLSLESFTIGPLSRRMDRAFWQDAFQNFRPVPHSKELIVIYRNSRAHKFESCWAYFNDFLCCEDVFPQLLQVDLRNTTHSESWKRTQRHSLYWPLIELRRRLIVTLWGERA